MLSTSPPMFKAFQFSKPVNAAQSSSAASSVAPAPMSLTSLVRTLSIPPMFIYDAKHGESYGIQDSEVPVEMAMVRERKRDMVSGLMDMHAGRFKDFGVDLIWGEGKFVGKKRIEITEESGKRVLSAEKVVVCTGSRAKIDDVPGLKESKPLTHVEVLELDVVPEHLIVLGGGYVGLEFAQAIRRLGGQVTVIERNKKMLKNEDQDIADVIVEVLEKDGVRIYRETITQEVSGESGKSVTLKGTTSGQPFEIKGSYILCATG